MIRAEITAELPCPVERVWRTVTDLSRQEWRGDVERVENSPSWSTQEVVLPLFSPSRGWSRPVIGPLIWRTRISKDAGRGILSLPAATAG